MKYQWINDDALNGGSANTQALKESIRAQRRRTPGTTSELERIVVGFWCGKIEVDAVSLNPGDKSVRVYVADVTEDVAAKICANFSARKAPMFDSCFVKGASKICFVLGASTPPPSLAEWIMVHVENVDPAVVV